MFQSSIGVRSTGSLFVIVDQMNPNPAKIGPSTAVGAQPPRTAGSTLYAKYNSLKFRVLLFDPPPGRRSGALRASGPMPTVPTNGRAQPTPTIRQVKPSRLAWGPSLGITTAGGATLCGRPLPDGKRAPTQGGG